MFRIYLYGEISLCCQNRIEQTRTFAVVSPRPLLPCPAPSVTAVTHLPVPHRLQPPRFRHPHRADGLHGAGGGDRVRDDVISHLSEMPGGQSGMIGVRVSHLSVSSCVLSPHCVLRISPHCALQASPHCAPQTSPHCAASPLVWC